MQQKRNTSLITTGLCAVLALGFLSQVQAEDKKADPTGTWTWTMQRQGGGGGGGGERTMSLKLKAEGDKVTGTLTSPGRNGSRDTEIADGKIKGDEISFTVTREFNGNKVTSKYSGKVSQDSIKGKVEFERDGQTNSRDWEAKRKTDSK
jgi:hypothetical protein